MDPILSGSVYLITSDGRTICLPIPSPSSNDPLNWTLQKRVFALASLFFFTILALVQMQGSSLLSVALQQEYINADLGPFNLDVLESSAPLMMGIGAILWIPLSIAIGRRPVFLLCTVILLGGIVWAGLSGSFYEHLAARCLQGLAAGACLSSIILMIIDLTFIHQRPQAIASYWSLCCVISNLVLSATPRIVSSGGTWRAFYWVWIGPAIASTCFAFFFCHETYFCRPAIAFDGHILAQSGTAKVKVYANWDEVPGGKHLPELPEKNRYWAMLHKLKIWRKVENGGWEAMKACYSQVLLCLLNPLIFWVTVLNALVMGSLISISTTYVKLLTAAPYNLPMDTISWIKLSSAAGAILAWPASGIMTQHISCRLASQNKGVRDAEHYLPAFVLPILMGCASQVVYGLAAELHWDWHWMLVSAALNYFSLIGLFTANTLWATEAFPQWAAAALVAVGGGSYIMAFGLGFVIDSWIRAQGYARPICTLGGFVLIFGCIGIPIAFWGKRLRQYINLRWGLNDARALGPQ